MAAQRSDNAGVHEVVEDEPLDEVDELTEPDEDVFDEEGFVEAPEDEAVFDPDVADVDDVTDAEDLDADADAGEADINIAVVEEIREEDSEEEDVLVRVVGEEDEELEEVDGLREGEFSCTSCYLVKGPTQLADATRLVCVDCV